ncbi:hypothetical protein ASG90_15340 [Nocardioides sp. Soil797]|nr:hypothetical protein ASG90_15340 [Nocardioides sp. Soil797]
MQPLSPPKIPRPEPAPRVGLPLEEQRWTSSSMPLLDPLPDGRIRVGFAFHDETATSVLLFVNRLTDEARITDSVMTPVGNGWWTLAYAMEPDWRASYAFVVHDGDGVAPWEQDSPVGLRSLLDRGLPDPRGRLVARNARGSEVSVVELPDAPGQPWRSSTGADPGDGVAVGAQGRRVWPHRTPGAGSRDPLVIVLDGEVWQQQFDLAGCLDMAVSAGALPPLNVVFVSAGDVAERWQDAGHAGGLVDFVAHHLVPWCRDVRGLEPSVRRTVITGQSLGALSALWTIALHPELVGAAVAQSASLWRGGPVAELSRAGRVRLHLEVGRQEWVLLEPSRKFAAELEHTEVDLTFTEFNGGHDYACWRGGLIDGLVAILG